MVTLVAGCVVTNMQQVTAPFDPAQLIPYKGEGTASISGQAFLKTRGGDVKLAAGETVSLTPAIPFIKEVRLLRDKGISPVYPDSVVEQIRTCVRKAMVDAQGNFEFVNLPSGEYLLEVSIHWDTGRGSTGGLVHKYAKVDEGSHERVMLTW